MFAPSLLNRPTTSSVLLEWHTWQSLAQFGRQFNIIFRHVRQQIPNLQHGNGFLFFSNYPDRKRRARVVTAVQQGCIPRPRCQWHNRNGRNRRGVRGIYNALSNLIFVLLECWNIALSTGFMVARATLVFCIAIFYLGRVDTPFLAQGVGKFGNYSLDKVSGCDVDARLLVRYMWHPSNILC